MTIPAGSESHFALMHLQNLRRRLYAPPVTIGADGVSYFSEVENHARATLENLPLAARLSLEAGGLLKNGKFTAEAEKFLAEKPK
jgi:hypothetical protein